MYHMFYYFVLIAILCTVSVVGWFANLVAVIGFASANFVLAKVTILMVLQIVGILVAPLGVVLGIVGFFI